MFLMARKKIYLESSWSLTGNPLIYYDNTFYTGAVQYLQIYIVTYICNVQNYFRKDSLSLFLFIVVGLFRTM